MKCIASLILVAALGIGSIPSHASLVPVSLSVTPDFIGVGWEEVSLGGSPLLQYSLNPTVDHTVTVALSDGTLDIFELDFIGPTFVILSTIVHLDSTQFEFSSTSGLNSSLTFLVPEPELLFSHSENLIYTSFALDDWDPDFYLYELNSVSYELPKGYLNPIPIPAAAWLFGTALIGLVGFSKRKKATI